MSHAINPENDQMSSGLKNEGTAAGSTNEESQPKIFKLDIDCFDEIFEYLSMKELHALGQTCKTMQRVTGVYFKENYSAAEKFCHKDGIYTVHSSREGAVNERIYTSGFNQYMPCISHYHDGLGPLEYLQSHIDEFEATNHIYMVELNMNKQRIKFIEKLLPTIEIVQIRNCWITEDFYELILKHCNSLKRIYLQNSDVVPRGWLMQHYPMLEHLELMRSVHGLSGFFERNPHVQRFSTNAGFLWNNQDELLKSNTKLDTLDIKEQFFYDFEESGSIKSIWDLLRQLHRQGFYKRLFLYTDYVDQNLSNKLTAVPGLETLCIRWFQKSFSIPLLSGLKELIILDGLGVTDAEVLANGLVKLERLYVDRSTIEAIVPFIRQSTKLNKIKMLLKDPDEREIYAYGVYNIDSENDDDDSYSEYSYDDDDSIPQSDASEISHVNENDVNNIIHLDGNDADAPVVEVPIQHIIEHRNENNLVGNDVAEVEVPIENEIEQKNENENQNHEENKAKDGKPNNWKILNLIALNKKREKLPNARKIILYVRDDVFLVTKWATRNGDINLNLIEMKRSDSLEWNHHY